MGIFELVVVVLALTGLCALFQRGRHSQRWAGLVLFLAMFVGVGVFWIYLSKSANVQHEAIERKVASNEFEVGLPAWAEKPRRWEGDVYIVPVATAFTTDAEGEHGKWENDLDYTATLELEQIIRAVLPSEAKLVRNHTEMGSDDWKRLYHDLKHRIWGSRQFLEVSQAASTVSVRAPSRYRMHGELRFDSASRQQINEYFARNYEVSLAWQPVVEAEPSETPAIAEATATSPTEVAGHASVKNEFRNTEPLAISTDSMVSWFGVGLLLIICVLGLVAFPKTRRGTLIAVGVVVVTLFAFRFGSFQFADNSARVPAFIDLSTSSSHSDETKLATTDSPSSFAMPVEATSGDRPEWVDQPSGLHGTIYRASIKSGLFVTVNECDRALQSKVRAAIGDYLDHLLGTDAADRISIDAALLRRVQKGAYRETVTSSKVGPMQQVHALLEFDDAVRSDLSQRWHTALANDRLHRAALAGGILLSLLAVAFGYLKLDLLTSGQARGRLRFAAVAAILLVATTAAIAGHSLLGSP
jgi:hypothetical protein